MRYNSSSLLVDDRWARAERCEPVDEYTSSNHIKRTTSECFFLRSTASSVLRLPHKKRISGYEFHPISGLDATGETGEKPDRTK